MSNEKMAYLTGIFIGFFIMVAVVTLIGSIAYYNVESDKLTYEYYETLVAKGINPIVIECTERIWTNDLYTFQLCEQVVNALSLSSADRDFVLERLGRGDRQEQKDVLAWVDVELGL